MCVSCLVSRRSKDSMLTEESVSTEVRRKDTTKLGGKMRLEHKTYDNLVSVDFYVNGDLIYFDYYETGRVRFSRNEYSVSIARMFR
jgi:hypothetical protein